MFTFMFILTGNGFAHFQSPLLYHKYELITQRMCLILQIIDVLFSAVTDE